MRALLSCSTATCWIAISLSVYLVFFTNFGEEYVWSWTWSPPFAFSNVLICFFAASFNSTSVISVVQNWQSKRSIDRALPLLVSEENTQKTKEILNCIDLLQQSSCTALSTIAFFGFFERTSSSFIKSLSPSPYQTLWSASLQKQLQQVVHALAGASLLFSTIDNPQETSTGAPSSRKCKTHRKQKP